MIGGIGFFVKAFLRPHGNDAPFILQRRDKVIAVLIGVFGGFVVGLTSVGSGTFFGLVMMIAFPLTAAKIVGTDLFQAALLLWVAGFGHFVTGSVDLGATGWLLIGSIPGVLIGSQLTVKLPGPGAACRALARALALGREAARPAVRERDHHRRQQRRDRGRARPSRRGGTCDAASSPRPPVAVPMTWPPELPVLRVRWARPTDRLDEVVAFYSDGLGLPAARALRGPRGLRRRPARPAGQRLPPRVHPHADGSPGPAPSDGQPARPLPRVEARGGARRQHASPRWATRRSSRRTRTGTAAASRSPTPTAGASCSTGGSRRI